MIGRNDMLAVRLVAVVALSGCAIGPDTSYVGEFRQPDDAGVVATAMAEFVSMRLPGAPGVLALDPTPSDEVRNALTPAFASALRRCGFTVGGNTRPYDGTTHRIRYLVTPLDDGILARLTIDGTTEGSQFFARMAGRGLQPSGPFTVTEAEARR